MTNMTFSSISGPREIEFSRDCDGLYILITERGDGYETGTVTIGFQLDAGDTEKLKTLLHVALTPLEKKQGE